MAQQLRDRLQRDPPTDPRLRDRMAADDHFAAGDGDRKLF
jgi:hypothetical protein